MNKPKVKPKLKQKSGQPLSARALAAQALLPVLKEQNSLSDTLPPALAAVNSYDRSLLQAIVFTSCRYALYYEELLSPLMEKAPSPPVLALLYVGMAQLLHLRIPDHAALSATVDAARELGLDRNTGFINAILRRFLREKEALMAGAQNQAAAPAWLRSQLNKDWGVAAANEWLEAANHEAGLTLRVNSQKISRADYLPHLDAENIAYSLCEYSPVGLRLLEETDVRVIPGFREGWISVQDEAAQLAASILPVPAKARILDACAAPGGKTAHLAELHSDAKILALDSVESRLSRIDETIERLDLQGISVYAADSGDPASWWDERAFDAILLDAPCTATGVIRRHPDIKLLRRPSDVPQTVAQQARLLNALWPILKSGGYLLYATCSLLKDENENQIAAFLQTHPDAKEQIIDATWGMACKHGRQLDCLQTDGFYYALLQKA
jgi:16S rRNA (cytosine967-C5)-methyltransferase